MTSSKYDFRDTVQSLPDDIMKEKKNRDKNTDVMRCKSSMLSQSSQQKYNSYLYYDTFITFINI